MKTLWSQILIIFTTLTLLGCFETPEFDNVPSIKFKDLRYIQNSESDSMLLRFDFQDGDGDIGLSDNVEHFLYPFHQYWYVVDSRDSLVTINDKDVELPFYAFAPRVVYPDNSVDWYYELFSETDNRPAYNKCDYWVPEDQVEDTLYIIKNELNNNFHVEFLKKKNGVYSKIYFSDPTCDIINFDGRIPIYDSDHNGKPLTGTITYRMYTNFWESLLTPDTFKLKFYIYDRAQNKSNIAESPDLLWEDILQ